MSSNNNKNKERGSRERGKKRGKGRGATEGGRATSGEATQMPLPFSRATTVCW